MAKEVKKRPKKAAAAAGRTRKLTKKQQRAKAKQTVSQRRALPGSFKLTWQVLGVIKSYWKTLGGVVLVYLVLYVLFTGGNISHNFSTIKDDLQASGTHGLSRAAAGFLSLVGSSGASGSTTGSTLQSALFVIASLAIIWSLRHLLSGQKITVKAAYYRSMAPLIPFLLVIFVIIIQLLPITVGAFVLSAVANSAFVDTTFATAVSSIILAMLAIWSLYMVSGSIFALYIVTLPEMEPRQALRSARDLVRYRRLAVLRKVFFMPLFIMVVMGVVIVPLILYALFLVPAVFFVLSVLALLFVHTYLYSLYRELLE
jgi:hypothetical protein